MNIKYASDLHLEFGVPFSIFEAWEGDILILAGDIVNYKLSGLDVLEKICTNFNHVIMVMGNHEHYGGNFSLTYDRLERALPSNAYLLEDEYIVINGQRFIGCTLWSYMNEIDCYFAKVRMNDYKVIRSGPPAEPWLRKLSPNETVVTWKNSTLYLEKNIIEGDVVITHHAPSFKSCNPNYEGNTAYASDLSDLILDTKPKLWIHGHLHDAVNYNIGDTLITSNTFGYYPSQNVSDFDVKEIKW